MVDTEHENALERRKIFDVGKRVRYVQRPPDNRRGLRTIRQGVSNEIYFAGGTRNTFGARSQQRNANARRMRNFGIVGVSFPVDLLFDFRLARLAAGKKYCLPDVFVYVMGNDVARADGI